MDEKMNIDDPEFWDWDEEDELAEVDFMRTVILDGICHSIQRGFWDFAFLQARRWWNVFDVVRVMYRIHPVTVDELLAGMQPAYREHMRELPHMREELDQLWEAYLHAPTHAKCKPAPGQPTN